MMYSAASTPVLLPGGQVLTSTVNQYIEKIDNDGSVPFGWPVGFQDSSFTASPVIVDCNMDEELDTLVIDNTGTIRCFSVHSGSGLTHVLQHAKIPALKVQHNWYQGLDEDVAHENYHHHAAHKVESVLSGTPLTKSPGGRPNSPPPNLTPGRRRRLLQVYDYDEDDALFENQDWYQEVDEWYRELPDLDLRVPLQDGMVLVPPHVHANPVLVHSLTREHPGTDGPFIVVAVSYFFDQWGIPATTSDAPGRDDGGDAASPSPPESADIDRSKYVSGGVVVLDIRSKTWLWHTHLDLSTKHDDAVALVSGTPAVADLEADGVVEVVVGTRLGFVYVLDGSTGQTKPGFPAHVGAPISCQVIAADLDLGSDGNLELVAAGDVLAVVSAGGNVMWSRDLPSPASSGIAVGDITGDAKLEIVVAMTSGEVFVYDVTGNQIQDMTLHTRDTIRAPVMLAPLTASSRLSIVVPSFDGFVYVWDHRRCVEKVDVGEHSQSQVVLGDTQGDGLFELLVATLNGHMYLLTTDSPAVPGTTHWQTPLGTADYGKRLRAAFTTDPGTVLKYVIGGAVSLEYVIVDEVPRGGKPDRLYDVRLLAGGRQLLATTVDGAGTHRVSVTLDSHANAIELLVFTRHREMMTDWVLVEPDVDILSALHWVIVLPLALGVGVWQLLGW